VGFIQKLEVKRRERVPVVQDAEMNEIFLVWMNELKRGSVIQIKEDKWHGSSSKMRTFIVVSYLSVSLLRVL
jgi:hypothetical protein